MSDSTLHIGALASNNVNNIVNEAGKYDEYKEKVKDCLLYTSPSPRD